MKLAQWMLVVMAMVKIMVQNLIAKGLDNFHLDYQVRIPCQQGVPHMICLPEGQLAAP